MINNDMHGNMHRNDYMQCPFLDVFGGNNEEMMDLVYMRKMYPKPMADIQMIVDDVCDRLDYDGSIMYDEYPDRIMTMRLCNHVCNILESRRNESYPDDYKDIVAVMLCNEMCRRRNKRRYARNKLFYI